MAITSGCPALELHGPLHERALAVEAWLKCGQERCRAATVCKGPRSQNLHKEGQHGGGSRPGRRNLSRGAFSIPRLNFARKSQRDKKRRIRKTGRPDFAGSGRHLASNKARLNTKAEKPRMCFSAFGIKSMLMLAPPFVLLPAVQDSAGKLRKFLRAHCRSATTQLQDWQSNPEPKPSQPNISSSAFHVLTVNRQSSNEGNAKDSAWCPLPDDGGGLKV